MQKALLLLAVLFVAGFSRSMIDEISPLWQIWKQKYQKTYSPEEEIERFAIFAKAYEKVVKFNAENDTPRLALNKFADLTNEEFKARNSGCAYAETDMDFVLANSFTPEVGALPASVDWRNKGAVTPIKNQGQCGSCWSFSTTGVVEGHHFIKSGKLVSFSEQQIVDCDTGTNQGCDGGYPYLAVEYVAKNGLETESDYPYTAEDGNCKYDKGKAVADLCSGYKFVTPDSTDAIKAALVESPVSVLIEADQDTFQYYSSGVIKTGCGTQLDHAVLAVGYTKVGVLEALIVKNSWGTDWGEEGYVYIWDSQTINGGKGVCGVLSQPMVPQ